MTTRSLAKTLQLKGLTLATAESCTGGLIAHLITNVPGSSSFLAGSVVAYANTVKSRFLGVPAGLIETHGAVSKQVAEAMAQGARKRFKVDIAIATTGIAGPTGGTPLKPVGLVYVAITSKKTTLVKKCYFTGSRASIKTQAAQTALGLLSQMLSRGF